MVDRYTWEAILFLNIKEEKKRGKTRKDGRRDWEERRDREKGNWYEAREK